MRLFRAALFLSTLAFCAVSGMAQTKNWRGDIPFAFKVKSQSFPPGVYDVSLDVERGLVSLSNREHPGQRVMWLGIPSDEHAATLLRFVAADDGFSLRVIAAGSWEARMISHAPKNEQEALVVFPH
jgi:hypothetical protein